MTSFEVETDTPYASGSQAWAKLQSGQWPVAVLTGHSFESSAFITGREVTVVSSTAIVSGPSSHKVPFVKLPGPAMA